MTTDSRPVIVVGNGPVGQTAALMLATRQVPVAVLDQRPSRDMTGSKAICQQRDVLDIWDFVGVGAAIADEGVTWTTARTFYRDGELFEVQLGDLGRSPFPPFVNISQTRTEQLLDERMASDPLIDTRWDHRVVAIRQECDGVVVRCSTSRGEVEITGSHAVVCAGARSDELRSALGLRFEGETFDDRFLICDIEAPGLDWTHERRFYFDPPWNAGRQVLIHPCPDSAFRIDWQVPADFDLEAETRTGQLEERVRAVVGQIDFRILWSSVYRFHSRIVDRMRVGNVLIAGDAAHLVAPFGARGLNSGVQDAENAAWKIAYVRAGWAGPGLLESYHEERRAAAVENIAVTGETMRFLVPRGDPEAAERQQLLEAAVTDSTARARVDSGRLAEPYWYSDSTLTTPDASRPVPSRPRRGALQDPGVGVIVPDIEVGEGRLRPLLRRGFTLLAGDEVPGAVLREAADMSPGGVLATYRTGELNPELPALIGARPAEAWIIRPDAHVAAVLDRPAARDVAGALRQALGWPPAATGRRP